MLLCTDVLLEVLAFFGVQAIFAGSGLNTASRLLSRLIAQHHRAIKRLFAKGPRAIGGKLEIEVPISETDCWHVCIGEEDETGANGGAIQRQPPRHFPNCFGVYDSPSKGLPLPVLPASQEILGLGNVSLILHPSTRLYNHEV
jgi:hypothetical protein